MARRSACSFISSTRNPSGRESKDDTSINTKTPHEVVPTMIVHEDSIITCQRFSYQASGFTKPAEDPHNPRIYNLVALHTMVGGTVWQRQLNTAETAVVTPPIYFSR